MNLEQLITLIIVLIIWGVSNIYQKVAKTDPRKRRSAGRTPGFFETVHKKLAALADTAGHDRKALEVDEYLQPSFESKVRSEEAAAAQRGPEWREEDGKSPPIPSATPAEPSRPQLTLNPTRQNLRNGVIWSEILAPPVALRDDKQ
ncbi:MAG: hypothetical protein LC633_04525 [Desulfobulbaceae bacterium]|nr:hypothetical protein [Desulfobulbaceae bacterium]